MVGCTEDYSIRRTRDRDFVTDRVTRLSFAWSFSGTMRGSGAWKQSSFSTPWRICEEMKDSLVINENNEGSSWKRSHHKVVSELKKCAVRFAWKTTRSGSRAPTILFPSCHACYSFVCAS